MGTEIPSSPMIRGVSEHQLQGLFSKVLCAPVILPALPHCLKGASLASTALIGPFQNLKASQGHRDGTSSGKSLQEHRKAKSPGARAL